MTNIERQIRMCVALEIVNSIYIDLCNTPNDEVGREQAYEFLCFLQNMQKFVHDFSKGVN